MNTTLPGQPAGASLKQDLLATREASRSLPGCAESSIAAVLNDLAASVLASTPEILAANVRDLARMDKADAKYDRLLLNPDRLQSVAADLRSVAKLPNPVGEVVQLKTLENGLVLSKVRVPMGVIAVIFESRPNVAFDVFALCLKTRNACVLKGSSDAHATNLVAVKLMQEALTTHGIDPRVVFLAPPQREFLPEILQAVGLIDLAIPRGSRGLIDFVRDHARIPVIETGAGVVHTYVDKSARLDRAAAIITNAKARRVSVCNALDTLLVHRDVLPSLPALLQELGHSHAVEVFADEAAYEALEGRYPAQLQRARDEHFGQEFLAYRMSVKTVAGLDEALQHIHRFGSRHSEAVLAEDSAVIEQFLNQVDAAVVLANTSTAFTDGGQFGMGAEIGISTQKLHARGPMALPELTSYKWVVRGAGQVRAGGLSELLNMAKVLVFQHVAAEPLGTLDPVLRKRGHRIRYVNFHREPDAQPDVSRYDALIVLGGPQMPDQGDIYPHLNVEMRCIEAAMKQDIPVLGICLGAQLLAYTLGGRVKPMDAWEIGWYDLKPTAQAASDPLFCKLVEPHPVFQWHGYTFDLPAGGVHLARTESCENQAFRYAEKSYGLQCHLELDERLINRWLHYPEYQQDLNTAGRGQDAAAIREQTHQAIGQSVKLSREIFSQFLQPLAEPNLRHLLPSR